MAKRKQLSRKNLFPKQEKARATKLLLYSSLLSCLLSPYQGSVAVYLTIVHSSLLHYQLYPVTDAPVYYHDDLTGIDLAELFYF